MIDESSIPEFLRPRNRKTTTPEIVRLLDQYKAHFSDDIPTECVYYSQEEICEIVKECLKTNQTFEEITGLSFEISDDEDL